jgi:hypothetical protein
VDAVAEALWPSFSLCLHHDLKPTLFELRFESLLFLFSVFL